MKKIGVVSAFDPHSDRKAHSGILYTLIPQHYSLTLFISA